MTREEREEKIERFRDLALMLEQAKSDQQKKSLYRVLAKRSGELTAERDRLKGKLEGSWGWFEKNPSHPDEERFTDRFLAWLHAYEQLCDMFPEV